MSDFLALFHNQPSLWLTGCALISLLVGSFLNVVIIRLPNAMFQEWQHECRTLLELDSSNEPSPSSVLSSIAWPGSHCPSCHTPLKAWHNVPLLSYLYLRGKCAFCNIHISQRYPFVEVLTAALGLLVAWILGPSLEALMALVLVYMLIALSFIDFDHKLLPDQLTLPLMWLGLVVNAFGVFTSLQDAFWGAIAGYMSLWLVYWGFRLTTGKQGMGYGDFKLLAALGAWMGWQALPIMLLVSSVAGIAVGVSLRFRKAQSDPQVPFGPFLSVGCLVYLLWGEQLWNLLTSV